MIRPTHQTWSSRTVAGLSRYRSNNQAPIANAGLDQTVTDSDDNGNETVTLNGSESTDDGTIVSYGWRKDGVLIAFGENSTVDVDFVVGNHTVELTVTDGNGEPIQHEWFNSRHYFYIFPHDLNAYYPFTSTLLDEKKYNALSSDLYVYSV